MDKLVLSWGRVRPYAHDVSRLSPERGVSQIEAAWAGGKSALAHGLGRSYGDVALNENGALLTTQRLNHFISADWTTGIVRAAAGLSNDELLRVSVPKGWFLPVTPGTKFVTLGGAVANDVHGKNHHHAGSFGAHVRRIGLLRSDTGLIECSPDTNTDLFALTIGGLGLTGIILWVELQMSPVRSAYLDTENVTCDSLEDFFRITEDSKDWPYTVMWVDCLATGRSLGRGIFSRGRPRSDGRLTPHSQKALAVPFTPPGWILNGVTLRAFNALYRHRPGASYNGVMHYDPFFYPLDRIHGWNKLYGQRGFFQHQSIIPLDTGPAGVRKLLERISASGQGSFLSVLKVHGKEKSPGVMSFCREGVSLALDFANRGDVTLDLLKDLDRITRDHGGRLYPAKDAHMSPEFYQESYPAWPRLESARDPKISSSFWRRVTQTNGPQPR